MSGYIGNIPVPQATQYRDVFTATAGQTSFATSGYTPNYLDVYLNGVKLIDGTDFTAANGSDIILTTGAALNDTIEVVSFSTFESAGFVPVSGGAFSGNVTVSGTVTANAFVGDGSGLTGISAGGGLFKGENGTTGTSAGDIFRINNQTLNSNVTITTTENASLAGPLEISDGITLTVEGNLSVI